ncbi:AP2/ERF and B3 domain-containing transcription factor At1g50680-like [Punica granatum]|uniref:AP2/ERF and B3 domain-containing transcription factor At1g50680-like n=1 Tax=Punica granatum TaxID=22663 RepID=A0A6P8DIF1_PUNGR|nr:AP2/ERF and B3 domain-containing transcription factor At1g50680-like [Punica granatum]
MAYDSAAINLRSRHSHRNFPWTTDSVEEPNFQSLFSQEAVLSMIKNWSYPSKFVSYHRVRSEKNGRCRLGPAGPNPVVGIQAGEGGAGFLCRQLFQKELTPSDVGKLNRLVIPKKYAVKYFPRISGKHDEGNSKEGGPVVDNILIFYDKLMRMWKSRYCY